LVFDCFDDYWFLSVFHIFIRSSVMPNNSLQTTPGYALSQVGRHQPGVSEFGR
jgi:hypothetical protein